MLEIPAIGEENSEFKPALFCSKINLVLHPAHVGGVR